MLVDGIDSRHTGLGDPQAFFFFALVDRPIRNPKAVIGLDRTRDLHTL